MNKPLSRSEVPLEQTWKLEDLYPTREAWSAALDAVAADAKAFGRFAGTLGAGAATLMACLDARDELTVRLNRAYAYASLWNAVDGGNPGYQALVNRAGEVYAEVLAALAFVDTEILALPDGTVQRFIAEEPLLAVHRADLDDLLRRKPHVLSPETERVLAALADVHQAPLAIYQRSRTSDLRFAPFADPAGNERPNTFNLYEWTYEAHPDAAVRRAAWRSFCDGLAAYENTWAATLATQVRTNVVLARARGYRGTEEYLLEPHKIALELYADIVQRVHDGVAPHMRRYARLRRRVLGLDELLYCDIKAPLDPGFDPRTTFDEARELIAGALAPMGAAYQDFVRRAFAERWIDRADNAGKAGGAFCATPYRVHPFILVTWKESMRDVFVLAHELGHGAHFSLAGEHQPRLCNTRPAMPFVEAPSITHEVLLARHLLAQTDDARMRRWVIMQVLGTYHHNFVTHLLEAVLLRQLYRRAEAGEAITAAVLNELVRGNLRRFWGDAVVIDDAAALTWMRQPHYYLGLYPYTYSVGLVAATALAEKARTEGAAVYQAWLEVLKAGGTLPPLELLRKAGIDLSTPAPVDAAAAYVGSLVDELEAGFA
jgi:oligoendopeptidase F